MSSDSIMLGSFMQWPDAIYNHTTLYLDVIWTYIESLDIDYIKWVLWVIYPIILSFLLPLLLLVFIYGSALFLQLYRRRHRLRDAYARDFWNGARNTLAAVWEGQGRIWHGTIPFILFAFNFYKNNYFIPHTCVCWLWIQFYKVFYCKLLLYVFRTMFWTCTSLLPYSLSQLTDSDCHL